MNPVLTKKLKNFFTNIKTIDELIIFDQEKDIKSALSRKILHTFTELGSSIAIFIIMFMLYLLNGKLVLYAVLPIYLFQLLVVETIKKTFNRSRPKTDKHRSFLGLHSSSGSFPSGHTANVFCLAFLITNIYQTNIVYITLLYIIASIVGLSRILLGKHYLIDVFAGAVFGIALGVLGTYLWIIIYKAHPEMFPGIFY